MSPPHILVVEDEPLLLEILLDDLQGAGFLTTAAVDGESAWRLAQANPRQFDTIILDRVMPDIDGIEVLKRIKSHADLSEIPVIMQTSLTSDTDISEGLQAGAFYYLTKPFSADALLAIVGHAVADHRNSLALQEEVRKTGATLQLLQKAEFYFRTREEARALAALSAQAAPDAQRAVLGLSELLLNAIEHGNLGITYAEKSNFLRDGTFENEINRRLADPLFGERQASLKITRHRDVLEYTIRDQGNGFDWSNYLEISPERAFDPHGRGIAMARMISFDTLDYRGNGNTVTAAIKLA